MLEEFAGTNIDKAFKFFNKRKLDKWLNESSIFETFPHLGRFKVLSSIVTGGDMRVVDLKGDVMPRPYRPILHKMAHPAILPDHGFAWTDGETIFLPVSMVDMPTEELEDDLAKLLIFFLSRQVRFGSLILPLKNVSLFESDQMLADVYWIVENHRIAASIFNEFSGLKRQWQEILPHLLKRRPEKKFINKSEERIESLLQKALISSSELPLSASTEESFYIAKALKDSWVEEGIKEKKYRGLVPFAPWGRLIPGKIKAGVLKKGEAFNEEGASEAGGENQNNDEKKSRYITKREEINEEDNEQGLALNIFDKMISWVRFVNVTRPFDDDPDEDSQKKADEMEELTTAQVKKTTDAIIDANFEGDEIEVEEVGLKEVVMENSYTYPEWDYKKAEYKDDYSIGFESDADEIAGDFVNKVLAEKKGLIKEVKRKFESLTPALRIEKRQLDGDAIDIDAAVEAMVDLKLGKQPDERLFKRHKRAERDISSLFLVDLSMSTDTWVKESRVIDHEKEALIVLCEALQSLNERYSIYGFSGQTRKKCTYLKIKSFDENYEAKTKRRIEGLIPYHYTRMGPAIRHSVTHLKKEPSEVKLLFILSDGKPNDVDSYEGKYGIEDTRMAIREAERMGIIPFCLTVDSEAHEYLPSLFGRGNYAVLSGVERLAKHLPDLYARIIRQL